MVSEYDHMAEKIAETTIIELELEKLGLKMEDVSDQQVIRVARALWGDDSVLAASMEKG